MRKTAYIDLFAHTVKIEDTCKETIVRFLGGRGYGAYLLYRLVPPEVKPHSPENTVIISSGLFSGTPWPAAARYHLTFRSPLTGIYGYANAGESWGRIWLPVDLMHW